MNNINKLKFNTDFENYLQNNKYTNELNKQINILINNVLYHYRFNDERLLKEDVQSELILNIFSKNEKIKGYENKNYYNLVYTITKNKFFDILRKYENDKKKIEAYKATLIMEEDNE